jgi:tRNA pseudouridine55 synthase
MHGVLLLDKPSGITSFQAVSRLRKAMGGVKAGHSGTLDPLATGLLVVLAGEATKIAPYLDEEPKEYDALMRLGTVTDTYDLEGEVREQRAVEADDRSIFEVLAGMVGRQEQAPPPYSAAKVRGKPLYKYARAGIEVEPRAREIEVFSLVTGEIKREAGACDVRLRVSCSRGTYIRSICHEAGQRLGCGACLAELRRTRAGSFALERALTLEEWRDRLAEGRTDGVISIAGALAHLPTVGVEGRDLEMVRNGHPLDAVPGSSAGVMVVTDGAGVPVALHALDGPEAGRTRVLRVLNLGSDPFFG